MSPLLRSAALPGSRALIRAVANHRTIDALAAGGRRLSDRGSGLGVQLQAVARAMRPLQTSGARDAFVQSLRAVIDARGQRVSANDRLYLLSGIPTLIVWGERDATIPLDHGRAAHAAIPGSRFVTLPRAAHFPHLEDPAGLAAVLAAFLEATEPARLDDEQWHAMLRDRGRLPRRPDVVAV